MTDQDTESVLTKFIREIWNEGDFRNLESLVTDPYEILSDPGDPWNRQSIDHQTFRRRVAHTRNAFPDVHFDVRETVAEGERIAIRWVMSGTHLGDLPQLPATGKPFKIEGMTFYYFRGGKICAHRQAFDQLGFLAQIGRLALSPSAP
jgi:steroid delta-isomerase-like uncharacterized protein